MRTILPARLARATWLVALALVAMACSEDQPLPFLPTPEPTPEQPRAVEVTVVAGQGGPPLAEAQITFNGRNVLTAPDGTVTLLALSGDEVEASASGHDPAEGEVPDDGDSLTIELRPNVARGIVTDPAGAPVAGVRVFVDGADVAAVTDEAGR